MILIDNLNLRLPFGLKSQANNIADEICHYLSQYPVEKNLTLNNLNLPCIFVNGEESNAVIAKRIAITIHQQLNKGDGVEFNGD